MLVAALHGMMLYACKNKTDGNAGAIKTENAGNEPKPFKVKSGYMESSIESIVPVTQKLWFDDYGNKQRQEMIMNIGSTPDISYIIIRDGYMYTFKNDTVPGQRRRFHATPTDYALLSEKDIKRYGIKMIGKEKLLGKECEVMSMDTPKMKAWTWNGLVLKSVMSMAGTEMTTECSTLREEPVDANLFDLPANKTFAE